MAVGGLCGLAPAPCTGPHPTRQRSAGPRGGAARAGGAAPPPPPAGLRREARSPGRGCRAPGAEALSGALSELALPSPGTNPDGIAAGPRQTIWVTETGSDAIARVTLLAARRASG